MASPLSTSSSMARRLIDDPYLDAEQRAQRPSCLDVVERCLFSRLIWLRRCR
jgi:hypothetical protein